MRSLTVKLTLGFLVVGLAGALLVALFVGLRTQSAFDELLENQGHTTLVARLAEHYATTGSWNGVAQVLADEPYRPGRPGQSRFSHPVLVDPAGRVVAGNQRYPAATQVSPSDLARSVPIQANNTVVGRLLSEPATGRPGPGTPEDNFLQRVTQAIIYSAIAATALALLLGVVIARTLTHPLRELTAATQTMAKGALGQQVAVRSRDELGALATSFNQMSADLAQASTLRRQMTADIAHDLRTPLSVILGYTEALRENKLPPEQDVFDTMHTEALHLQRLIDDLRTLSLADAGELPLARQPVAPQTLLERAAATYKTQARASNITLALDLAPQLPMVEVDVERMAQVLGNLLSNALRYTPAGGTIRLSAEAHDAQVHLHVQDTGSGIAPDDLPHVFDRFYRADPARQPGTGSSGLGLAIAKSLVEAHGGSISVDSMLEQGTTFTIALPAHARAHSASLDDQMPVGR